MHWARVVQKHFCYSLRFVMRAQTFVWRTLSVLSVSV